MIFKFGLQGKAYFKFDSSSSLALRSPDFRKRSGASSAQPVILCLFFFLWYCGHIFDLFCIEIARCIVEGFVSDTYLNYSWTT